MKKIGRKQLITIISVVVLVLLMLIGMFLAKGKDSKENEEAFLSYQFEKAVEDIKKLNIAIATKEEVIEEQKDNKEEVQEPSNNQFVEKPQTQSKPQGQVKPQVPTKPQCTPMKGVVAGNSGKIFKTQDEAENWAWQQIFDENSRWYDYGFVSRSYEDDCRDEYWTIIFKNKDGVIE